MGSGEEAIPKARGTAPGKAGEAKNSMGDGGLELTSCCAGTSGTHRGRMLLCPQSVPTRNSLWVLQLILLSAHSPES